MTLSTRLNRKGPKRILALDGGGIRGTITLGFLDRIEAILRRRYKKPDLRLCDYFDLIGGSSTGAIIAASLAVGMSTAEIRQHYLDLGGHVFSKKRWRQWTARFDERPLVKQLKATFSDLTIGDSSLCTGLCIVTKRADTGSVWPLINHPDGKFYSENSDIRIWEALRASAAAPVYFMPLPMEFEDGQKATFLDGGVSLANNPALQLFLVATLKGFPFRWKTGEKQLLLVSLGTGCWTFKVDPVKLAKSNVMNWAATIPAMFMEDAQWQNQLILQYLSRTSTPWTIDSEVGDLSDDLLGSKAAMTYLRYNVRLEPDALDQLGLERLSSKYQQLREMSSAENRFDLDEIGQRAAAQIQEEHFTTAFDLPDFC